MTSDSEKYWYNLKTGEVEKGFASPVVDRAGPFDTPEEAATAPERLKERSRQWDEDDAAEAEWGSGTASDESDRH